MRVVLYKALNIRPTGVTVTAARKTTGRQDKKSVLNTKDFFTMAQKIKTINAFRPRIEQGSTVQKPELLRAVSRATRLVEGSVDLVTKEMRDQIILFCSAGRAVRWKGWELSHPASILKAISPFPSALIPPSPTA